MNNDFWSQVRWFAKDFHEWRFATDLHEWQSHEWKSLANDLTREKNRYSQ